MKSRFDDLTKKMRKTRQRSAGLEHDARQPRLATEADVPTDTKTIKCAEDATADQAKDGDSCSAKRVDPGLTSLTSFGKIAEPTLAPEKCTSDALVDKSAAVPKACLSPVEIRTLTATGGLLPTGTASTAMRIIVSRPLFS